MSRALRFFEVQKPRADAPQIPDHSRVTASALVLFSFLDAERKRGQTLRSSQKQKQFAAQ